jgi:putative ABC transport system ATP-binding protein
MKSLIELTGVSKHYRLGEATVPALKAVDLVVRQGEFTALSGPSGSGKTTLLNICGLLDAADTGSYRLQGEDITGLDARSRTRLRRQRIGFVFQNFNLVPVMTAFENVEYPLLLNDVPAAERKRRVEEILEQVGIANFARHVPDKLSGGQRQRVAIARALVKHPALVIADEPTANLDTVTANQIIDLMHHFAAHNGATFLVATHDQRMTARCERVVQLVDGAIQHSEAAHARTEARV